MTPVKFWPYTTIVCNRIIELDWGNVVDREEERARKSTARTLRDALLTRFNKAGVRCADANKIAFEVLAPNKRPMFIGFYDFHMAIGFSVAGDHVGGYNNFTKQYPEKL